MILVINELNETNALGIKIAIKESKDSQVFLSVE